MLDVLSFIEAKGGNPELIRESQRRRHAPVERVDEIIALYDEWRRAKFTEDTKAKEINLTQKEIGLKKKVCLISPSVRLEGKGILLKMRTSFFVYRIRRMRKSCLRKRSS